MVPSLPGGRTKGIGGACKNVEGSLQGYPFFQDDLVPCLDGRLNCAEMNDNGLLLWSVLNNVPAGILDYVS